VLEPEEIAPPGSETRLSKPTTAEPRKVEGLSNGLPRAGLSKVGARTAAYPEDVSEQRASSLGGYIRRQRELSEVSMRQFAELAGISNPYLSQIERGLRAPSEQVLQSIADALQVSADTLYDQAGVPREKDGPPKVVQAIREDPKLTGRQRQALIEVYEAFVGVGVRPRRS
jgi:transcriptional regulator with XRE-family HTH domain